MKFLLICFYICQIQGNPGLVQYFKSECNQHKSAEIIDLVGGFFVDDVIKSLQIPRKLKTLIEPSYESSDDVQLVLFVSNITSFYRLTDHMNSSKAYYTTVFEKISMEEIKIVFEKLWFKNILNVNILRIEENCEKLYTFKPFQKNEICQITQPILISEFINASWTSTEFFPEKLSNLHNCTIKASGLNNPFTVIKTKMPDGSFHLNGTEVKLIREVAKALNFHVEIDCSETLHGSVFDNQTATHNIKRIFDGDDDMVLGSYYLRANRAKYLSHTQFYRIDYTKIIGPLDPLFTPSEILIKPFEFSLWIALSLVLIASMLGVSMIRKIKFRNLWLESVQHVNIFTVIFGGSQNILPKKDFNRILLAFFALFCIIIRTVYQGKLFTFMQNEPRKKGPTTIDAMIDEKYTFFMTESFTEFTSELRIRERYKVFQELLYFHLFIL
jgi:hypothetical protein